MQKIFDITAANHARYLAELTEYLKIPSISSDPAHNDETRRAAEHTAGLLKTAGFEKIEIHPTDGHPVVTASWHGAPGKPTVLLYGHYDVQPVDPLELWTKPPFEPHVENKRIVARGSADDKGQVFMHIKAFEAMHKANGKFPVNVVVCIEGEEEVGSPNLPGFLKDHKSLLKSDVAVVSDVQMWDEGIPAITYGLRGLIYMEVEFIGPNRDLHSGSYGGAVANPCEILARVIASAKDAKGRILIPGIYDKVRPLAGSERELMAKVPFNEAEYKKDLDVAELWGEEPFSPLERKWARPTFEVNGIWGGFTGPGAKTVLPAKANAKISMRLVPDQDPEEAYEQVEAFIRKAAPKSMKVKITRHHGGKPVVVDLKSPYMKAASRALKESFGREPLFIREGGSIPICADFKEILGLDTLLIGYCLPDARAHSPNENLHLPTFYTGIDSIVKLYHYLAE